MMFTDICRRQLRQVHIVEHNDYKYMRLLIIFGTNYRRMLSVIIVFDGFKVCMD